MTVQTRYDEEHDVLYLFFGEPRVAYEDEVASGVFLRRDESTDEVVGVVIMGMRDRN